jgi:hypothetical protein
MTFPIWEVALSLKLHKELIISHFIYGVLIDIIYFVINPICEKHPYLVQSGPVDPIYYFFLFSIPGRGIR